MKVLLPIFYLPPISWFSVFHNAEEVYFEQFENFPKQTYRNRTVIYGANGRLPLIIPISHKGTRALNTIEISEREDWRSLHWKSIKNAYQSSPYFEFYEDRLAEIFSFTSSSLVDFNLNAISIIQKILKTEKQFHLTNSYESTPIQQDFRSEFSAKQPSAFELEEYYQTFSDKFGFEPDLSVIDLICNKGPETLTYIKNIITK